MDDRERVEREAARVSLGAVIKTLREARGLTRADLAKEVGLGVVMLAKVEQGARKPSLKTLRQFANILEVELPTLQRDANTWQAGLAAGVSASALRAAVLTTGGGAAAAAAAGSVAVGLPVMGPVAAGLAARQVALNRRDRAKVIAALQSAVSELDPGAGDADAQLLGALSLLGEGGLAPDLGADDDA